MPASSIRELLAFWVGRLLAHYGLDVGATRAMRRLIRGMRAAGRCVLFSSHIMQEVAALCDRIVIISRGRTVAQGTPDEILSATGHSNLEDAFVALTGIDEVGA